MLKNAGSIPGVLCIHLTVTDEGDGAHPEPEPQTPGGGGVPNSDLPDYLDVIIVYCHPENVLHLVEGAETHEEAVQKLIAGGVPQEKIIIAGKLRDLHCNQYDLDTLMEPGEASLLQILVHLEQYNEAQGDYAVVTKTLKLTQTECQ
jgi:hypothetical protein